MHLPEEPEKVRPAAMHSFDTPPDINAISTSYLGHELHAEIHERRAGTPTTPTFILSPMSLFGGDKDKGEPMLLGGWSRGKGSLAKGPKQRPSLIRPSALLSSYEKTDVVSLASHDGQVSGKRGNARGFFGLPSLRHLFHVTKGRREMSSNVRVSTWFKTVIALVCVLFLSCKLLFDAPAQLERDSNGDFTRNGADGAVFLNEWINHVIQHPVRARDKTGFAEMGLRTEIYSHLLRHPTLPNFDRMERALWPFVPGVNQLRRWWQASVQAKPPPYAVTASDTSQKLVSRGFGFHHQDRQPGSRGIVMSLGYKGSIFASQFISIIREKHQNDIPVELYYYGDSDLPAKYRDYLTKTYRNVRCVDLESLGLFDPDLVQLERQGFAIKPFALLATNFTEVILADADAILLEDPSRFFEEPGYLDTGTLFFHDRDHLRPGTIDIISEFMNNQLSDRGPSQRLEHSEFWKKKGIFEQESGIVVVDKRKTDVFAALLFTAWQNMGEIRKKTTYRIWWGDKETFWLAFEFARFPYYFVPRYAQAIGTTRKVKPTERKAAAAAAKLKAAKALAAKDGKPLDKAQEDALKEAFAYKPSAEDLMEEEELCSEHPLHFLGADIEDADGDGLKEALTLGRPAWFNGGILDDKTLSDEVYIEPNTFTLGGDWEFLFDEERWCIRNYTKGDLHDFELTQRIDEIKGIARNAENQFRTKIPKTKSAKEAAMER